MARRRAACQPTAGQSQHEPLPEANLPSHPGSHLKFALVGLKPAKILAFGLRRSANLDVAPVAREVRTCVTLGWPWKPRLGGKPFSRGALYRLLANRVYIGQAVHKGKAYPGEHEPIIDRALFTAVQEGLAGRRVARINGARAAEPSLLGGRLLDAQGECMSPSHAVKNHKRYRYYTSQALLQGRSRKAGRVTRVPAHDIEAVVIAEVRSLLQDPGALLDMLTGAIPDLAEQQALLQAAAALAERWPDLTPAEVRTLVRAVIGRVIMRDDQLDIELSPACLRDVLLTGRTPCRPRAAKPAASG